jgi:hypothetical protein
MVGLGPPLSSDTSSGWDTRDGTIELKIPNVTADACFPLLLKSQGRSTASRVSVTTGQSGGEIVAEVFPSADGPRPFASDRRYGPHARISQNRCPTSPHEPFPFWMKARR